MSVLRFIAAVLVGVIVGSIVNMGLVMLGGSVIPVPDGVDVTNSDSIASSMHLLQPRHFVFPFLAHAIGTLVGAVTAHLIAGIHRNVAAYTVGVLFFAGGIVAASMIPGPVWFVATDLILAYFPMAFMAAKIGCQLRSN